MITLDGLNSALHSVEVANAAGDALAIDAAGKLNVKIEDDGNSITVDAVDLDIRDLAFATDKVDVSGSEVSLDAATLAALESITVVATDLDIRDLSHTQDSVKIGDGTDFLAVNADGSINAQFVEAGYASWSVVAAAVTNSESQLVASPLAGRLRVEIQNLGTQDVYIRNATGVTTANGLKIPKGSSYEQALDDNSQIWAITPAGSTDLRIAQYAS